MLTDSPNLVDSGWRCTVKRSRSRKSQEGIYERKIVDAFVEYQNKAKASQYDFNCRPDDVAQGRQAAPDFRYVNLKTKEALCIELGRITVQDLGRNISTNRSLQTLQRQLNGVVKGTYLVIVRSDKIPSGLKTTKIRKKFHTKLVRSIIKRSSKTRKAKTAVQLFPGIILIKLSSSGSVVDFYAHSHVLLKSSSATYMMELIQEACRKFSAYQDKCGKNQLLLLTRKIRQRWWETGLIVRDIIRKFRKDKLVNIDLIDDVYEIVFDLDWNNGTVVISKCYPNSMSGCLCDKSAIFHDQSDYGKFLNLYFHGFT